MKKDSVRTPGRPRGFNKDEALKAATEVFWHLGYENASLDELTSAMKISRPSLYAAFGDKEGLFLACTSFHGDRVMRYFNAAVGDETRAALALMRIYEGAIERYTALEPVARGCMFAAAALSDVAMSDKLRSAVAAQLERVSSLMLAVVSEDPPKNIPAEEATRLAMTLLHGLSSRARLGVQQEVLIKDAKALVGLLYS